MLRIVESEVRLPESLRRAGIPVVAKLISATVHAVAAATIGLSVHASTAVPAIGLTPSTASVPNQIRHIVFAAPQVFAGRGGGGGGTRQAGPIRQATRTGADPMTLRVARTVATVGQEDAPATNRVEILLDAVPLACGGADQIGLPVGGVSFGTSTGPGSGGGVGDGIGTGIGSGRGPGIGPGSGGGTGAYRVGNGVTPPRVITQVEPTYNVDALSEKIQGTVVLEFVVRANGRPSNVRVVRSLDPGRLDEEAIRAASQWRFEPGRLAGTAVDVLVRLAIDFSIR